MLLFVSSTKLTTAANAIFLQSTAPLYVLLLAPIVLREPVRRSDVALLGAFVAGLAFIVLGEAAPNAHRAEPRARQLARRRRAASRGPAR